MFIFSFTERSIVVGSTVMRANIPLIRALHFPRACLPLAYVMVEFQQLLLSLLVRVRHRAGGTGEPLTWYWLLLVPVLLLQGTFNVGAALLMARLGAGAQDFSQLIPFLTRVWRYFCGVMYSITSLPRHAAAVGEGRLQLNPAAVYISLARFAIMSTQRANAPGAKPYNAGGVHRVQRDEESPPAGLLPPDRRDQRAVAGRASAGRSSRSWWAWCSSGRPRRGTAAADARRLAGRRSRAFSQSPDSSAARVARAQAACESACGGRSARSAADRRTMSNIPPAAPRSSA